MVEEPANHDRWLISYADFMTLLFAFFVVLFASSYRDNQAIKRLDRVIISAVCPILLAQDSQMEFLCLR